MEFLAERNGYDPTMIKKIWSKINGPKPKPQNKKYVALPFLGKISYEIGHFLERFDDIKVAFKSQGKLSQLVMNHKGKSDENLQSGVYKLKCAECPNITYVGSTSRSFEVRKNEHLSRPKNSSFGFHLKYNNHHIDEENSKIISKQGPKTYKKKLELIEMLEVHKSRKKGEVILNKKVNIQKTYQPIFTLLQ